MLELDRLARTISAGLLLAAGCAPGIPEPSESGGAPESARPQSTRDCNIPAHIRGTLPEAIARATEVACLPTPTPDTRAEAAKISDIKIERELFARCDPGRTDPKGDDMWGGWMVRLDNPNYYLKNGKFEMEFRTPSGGLIARHPIPNIRLPSGAIDYIPAWIDPAPKQRALFGAGYEVVLSGKGSQLGKVELKMKGPMEFVEIDQSAREYNWEAAFAGTGFIPNNLSRRTEHGKPYLYPRGNAARSFYIGFVNNSERAINQVGIFGLALGSGGELVDVFAKSVSKIPYGESRTIEVGSLSDGGRCARPEFFGPFEFLYWVNFETHTGMPVVKHERVKIPHWASSAK